MDSSYTNNLIYGMFYRRKIEEILHNDKLSFEEQVDKIEETEYKEGKRIALILSRTIAILYLIDVLYFILLQKVFLLPKLPNTIFNTIAACYLFPCAIFFYAVSVQGLDDDYYAYYRKRHYINYY